MASWQNLWHLDANARGTNFTVVVKQSEFLPGICNYHTSFTLLMSSASCQREIAVVEKVVINAVNSQSTLAAIRNFLL